VDYRLYFCVERLLLDEDDDRLVRAGNLYSSQKSPLHLVRAKVQQYSTRWWKLRPSSSLSFWDRIPATTLLPYRTASCDEDVFAVAWKENRIPVTHDPDFLDDRRFPLHRNPGIVVIRPGSSGRNDRGLIACLYKAIQMGRDKSGWFRGVKFDFSSEEEFSIQSRDGRQRYRWAANQDAMIWED
jgi:predicted nuclease of predicted toxin-antitoxin system